MSYSDPRTGLYYTSAPGSIHGRMICGACSKPITEGEYRVREKSDRYITHHRACLPDDPVWAKLDEREAQWNRDYQEMREDVAALLAKWDGKFAAYQIADELHDERAVA